MITVLMGVVSSGPVSKMHHLLGLTGLREYFADRLYSGYDLKKWKLDPAVIYHAAQQMQVNLENCLLVEDSFSGVEAGIAACIPVYHYYADPHNPPINHTLVFHLPQHG